MEEEISKKFSLSGWKLGTWFSKNKGSLKTILALVLGLIATRASFSIILLQPIKSKAFLTAGSGLPLKLKQHARGRSKLEDIVLAYSSNILATYNGKGVFQLQHSTKFLKHSALSAEVLH